MEDYLIETIEELWPADSEYPDTAQVGSNILFQAIENTYADWRKLPIEVLEEYARLCMAKEWKDQPNAEENIREWWYRYRALKLKNFAANVEYSDLEARGWDFEELYGDIANGMGLPIEEAKEYHNENYYVRIFVTNDGSTYWEDVDRYGRGSFNRTTTGDDEKTREDLIWLWSEDKLWNVYEEYDAV